MAGVAEKEGKASTARAKRLTRKQMELISRALADPHRFELLEKVAAGCDGKNCSEMREGMSISAATLSHHLKELATAGLVEMRREGKYVRVLLQKSVWDSYIERLSRITRSVS